MKKIFSHCVVLMLLLVSVSCGKQSDYIVSFVAEVTPSADGSKSIATTISSNVDIEHRGLIYSLDSVIDIDTYYNYWNPDNSTFARILDETNSEYKTYKLTGLQLATTYHYRLFSVYRGLVKYSAVKSFATDCPGLGCGPAGGQIIYLDGNGGGIEVAQNYVTPSVPWGCSNVLVGGTSSDIGAGQANTNNITSTCGTNILATYCADYSQNGFSDYYMPSKDELELIYSKVYGQFSNPYQWPQTIYYSSTESSTQFCHGWDFNQGSTNQFSKQSGFYKTIPVRSF